MWKYPDRDGRGILYENSFGIDLTAIGIHIIFVTHDSFFIGYLVYNNAVYVAPSAVMVERAPEALRVLEANIKRLGAEEKALVWRADVWDVLKASRGQAVDLIYADPPYREVELEKLLEAIDASSFANDDTVVIIEHDETVKCSKGDEFASWRCYRSNSYGKAQVSFFGRIGSFKSEEEA